ncbi:MAG: histidine kinase [Bacteroidota bacterium]
MTAINASFNNTKYSLKELNHFKSKIITLKDKEDSILYKEIISWLKKLSNKNEFIEYSIDLARLYIKNKQVIVGEKLFQKAIQLLKNTDKRNYVALLSKHIEFLHDCCEYQKAVEHYLNYTVIKNEIQILDKKNEIEKFRKKYKDAEQQKEIERLNNEKILQEKLVEQVADINKTNEELVKINSELYNIHWDLMETKILRSQMNPHFIYNTLNSISSLIKSHKNKEAISYLQKFSKLTSQIFKKHSKGNISLKEELDFCLQYISLEKLRFGDKIKFDLKIDESINTKEQFIPSMILQPLLENAVKHGIFHKQNEHIGLLSLKIKNHKKHVAFTIQDNGIGFKKTPEEIFLNERESSVIIINKRVNIFNKLSLTTISIQIKSSNKTGTKLHFKLNK